jgi:hypothetical protein
MYKSVCIVLGIIGNTNSQAHIKSRLETGVPKGIVDFNVRKGQNAHSDRTFLIVANSDKIALFSYYTYYFAFLNAIIDTKDCT